MHHDSQCRGAGIQGLGTRIGSHVQPLQCGTKQFLGIENGRLVLGGEKVDVTLSAVNDTNTPGFFRLTSPDGTWHADLYGTPSLETDKFSQWRIEPVNGKKDIYAIASRNTEASIALSLSERSARTSRCRTAAALRTV